MNERETSQDLVDFLCDDPDEAIGYATGANPDGTVNVRDDRGNSINAIAATPIVSQPTLLERVNGTWYAFQASNQTTSERTLINRRNTPTQVKQVSTIKAAFYTYNANNNEGNFFVGGDRTKPVRLNVPTDVFEAAALITNLGKTWRVDFLGLTSRESNGYTQSFIFLSFDSKGARIDKPLSEITPYYNRDVFAKLLGSGFSTFVIDVGDGLTAAIGYWFLAGQDTQTYQTQRNTTEYALPDRIITIRSPELNLTPILVNTEVTKALLLDRGTRTSPTAIDVFRLFDGTAISPRLANTPPELLDRSYRPAYDIYQTVPRGQVTSWVGDSIYFVQRPRSGPIASWFANPSAPVLVDRKVQLTIKGYKIAGDRFVPLPDKTAVMQPLGSTPVTINSLSFHP